MRKLIAVLVVIILLLSAYVYDLKISEPTSGSTTATSTPAIASTTPQVVVATSSQSSSKPVAAAVKKPTTPTTSVGVPPAGTISSGTTVSGCSIFPSNNAWNTDISRAAVHSNSAAYIASIGASGKLHADFGGRGEYGIPYVVVPSSQPQVPINFTAYGDESDPGPYPVPLTAPIEGGSGSDGDRHVLVLQQGACKLYELYRAFQVGAGWNADSGAVFDLNSNALRPDYWTSADAAGLPVFPGLLRYEEVAAGEVTHAVRFTVQRTQKGFIHPATHFASSRTDTNLPPMGLRLRLKADFDTSRFTGQSKVILEGFKKYGIILADNGSNWYITGAADPRWNDDDLNQLKTVPGSAFEAVDTGPIIR